MRTASEQLGCQGMPWRSHRMLCRAQPQCTEVTMFIYLCRIKPSSINLSFSSSLHSVLFHLWLICSCKLFGRHIPLHLVGFCFSRSFYPWKVIFLLFFLRDFYKKTHQYTEFRPLSRSVIMDTCFDTVISEWGCYQSVGGEECLLSCLTVSLLLHVSMLWMQFCLYLWSPGKMLSTLVVLKINIILLCRAHSSFNRTRQFKQVLTESG